MTILIMANSMQIRVENNKILTRIVRLLDSTPLRWYTMPGMAVRVDGKKELLYELLSELTTMYLGIIEII